jgi:uncharacterized repeat protein (TIGR02543 family)
VSDNDKYEDITYLTLTAVPSAGYVFDSWSGHTAGIADIQQNPVTFQMGDRTDNNRVIAANFTLSDLRYTLTASSDPSSGGSVRLDPEQPSEGYPVNRSVTVTAVAQAGYVFRHWVGDAAGTENPRTILISEDKSITAIFNPTVTTYCSPSEAGSVSLEPIQSINGYTVGTEVTVTAEAAKGYRFDAWEGDASSSDKSITITVDEAKTIIARFERQTSSPWWPWVIVGLAGLIGVLILLRLVYARVNRGKLDEPQSMEGL